jgi:hypothetical protein
LAQSNGAFFSCSKSFLPAFASMGQVAKMMPQKTHHSFSEMLLIFLLLNVTVIWLLRSYQLFLPLPLATDAEELPRKDIGMEPSLLSNCSGANFFLGNQIQQCHGLLV